MPIRPFPSPISIGFDICQFSRIRSIVFQPPQLAERFYGKFLTSREQRYLRALHPRIYRAKKNEIDAVTQYLAGRWAAKEAAIKAVKPRKLRFLEVEVWPSQTTQEPFAIILNKAARTSTARGTDEDSPSQESEEMQTGDDETKNAITKAVQEVDAAGEDEPAPGPQNIKIDGIDKGDHTQPMPSAQARALKVLQEIMKEECDGQIARVSISHDGEYACAVVLAVEDSGGSDVGGEAAAREFL